jgi:hypothetical protein
MNQIEVILLKNKYEIPSMNCAPVFPFIIYDWNGCPSMNINQFKKCSELNVRIK